MASILRRSLCVFLAVSAVTISIIAEEVSLKRLPLNQGSGGEALLEMIPFETTGIEFVNRVSAKDADENRLYEDGSGLAAGDVNGDGMPDLFFAGMGTTNRLYLNQGNFQFLDVTAQSGLAEPGLFCSGALLADFDNDGDLDLNLNTTGAGSRLYLNQGNGRFELSAQSGLRDWGGARSSAAADVDRDGDLDLYVAHYRAKTAKDDPVRMRLRKVGDQFEVPARYRPRFSAETAADGGVALIEWGEPDAFYLNDGSGNFKEVEWASGRWKQADGRSLETPPHDWGLSAQFRDINLDGWPDLYVCNDYYSPDRLWWNLGGGIFQEADPLTMTQTCWASMAVDVADLDRDGFPDLFTADMAATRHFDRMRQRSNLKTPLLPQLGWGWDPVGPISPIQVMRNTLQRNRGDHTFQEVAFYAGLSASDWTWGAIFSDVDLDGWSDLLIANGHARDWIDSDLQKMVESRSRQSGNANGKSLLDEFPPLLQNNLLFLNQKGMRFQESGEKTGWSWKGISNGMVLADLDQDGDNDIILNNWNSPARIYKNTSVRPRLQVELGMKGGNPQAIGARLKLSPQDSEMNETAPQMAEIISGGRYLSSGTTLITFATPQKESENARWRLEISWPDGELTRLSELTSGFHYRLSKEFRESQDPTHQKKLVAHKASTALIPLFSNQTQVAGLATAHQDVGSRKNSRQPLAPDIYSQRGPAAAWADIDWDGKTDLIFDEGLGGKLSFWLQRGVDSIHFLSVQPNPATLEPAALAWLGKMPFGLSGSIVTAHQSGESTLWTGQLQADHDSVNPSPTIARFKASFSGIQLQNHRMIDPANTLIGPACAADWNLDGSLEVFFGGSGQVGSYPAGSPSIFFNGQNALEMTEVALPGLDKNGLLASGPIQSALGTDLNADGRPDLVLAEDWGTLHIYINLPDGFVDFTSAFGMDRFSGRWKAVIAGDWNGDGLMDLAASNLGRNSKYEMIRLQSGAETHALFWLNSGAKPSRKTLEVFKSAESDHWLPWESRDAWLEMDPTLIRNFPLYRNFAEATLGDLIEEPQSSWNLKTVSTLEHSIFLNQGEGKPMRRIPLPESAQYSPGFGLAGLDANGDGNLDLALAQNDFSLDIEHGRQDAGLGMILSGKGDGTFQPLTSEQSGIRIQGPQRSLMTADYDADGRSDLLWTRNGSRPELFRNQAGKPGLRLRALGPAGNPWGIGAQFWLSNSEGQTSFVTELRCGEGWLSQNEPVGILHWNPLISPAPNQLNVRWPGGRVMKIPLESTEPLPREIRVSWQGRHRILTARE